jgi:hypothetical protein
MKFASVRTLKSQTSEMIRLAAGGKDVQICGGASVVRARASCGRPGGPSLPTVAARIASSRRRLRSRIQSAIWSTDWKSDRAGARLRRRPGARTLVRSAFGSRRSCGMNSALLRAGQIDTNLELLGETARW